MYELRSLLSVLCDKSDHMTREQLSLAGFVLERRLLESAWSQTPYDNWLVIHAIIVWPDTVKEKVHGAQPRDAINKLDATKRVVPKALLLPSVERVVRSQIPVGRQEEAAGAAGRVRDHLAGHWPHAVDQASMSDRGVKY